MVVIKKGKFIMYLVVRTTFFCLYITHIQVNP